MLPLRLRLHNFMCYRDPPPLDLEGLRVVCLAGPNGHGKSALLDAITWALWGWARGRRYGQGGAPHDELVHQGQAEMEVELEFEADGLRYRVVRHYTRALRRRQPASYLDLSVRSGRSYRSLMGNTIRETEERIQRLLRLDYGTFINSAFLLQNRSDLFINSPPAERKRVLGEVLGISIYERLAQRARDRARLLERGDPASGAPGLHAIQARREEALRQVSRRGDYARALEEARQALGRLAPLLKEARARLEAVRREVQALRLRQEDLARLEGRARQAREEAERLAGQAQRLRARLQEARALVASEAQVEEAYRRYLQARERLEQLEASAHRYRELREQETGLQAQVDKARFRLETELDSLRRLRGELEPRAGRLPQLEGERCRVQRALEALERREESLRREEEELQGHRVRLQSLAQERERLLGEVEDRRRKYEILARSPEPRCPLCQTPLKEDARAHLEAELARENSALGERLRQTEAHLRDLSARCREDEARLAREARALRERREGLRNTLASLEQEIVQARRAQEEVGPLREKEASLQRALDAGDYAPEARGALEGVRRALASLGYDPGAHRRAREEVLALEEARERHRRLQEARERLPDYEADLSQVEALRDQRLREEAEALGEAGALRGELARLPQLLQQEGALAQEVARLEGQERDLRVRELQAQEGLERCRQLEVEAEELRGRIGALERELRACRLLEGAFGRNGVPAQLIDAAIPELEREANVLLSRLTAGRMALKLETQRLTRRGDLQETLEMLISDELGTRPYELFSGGEAFRINFALRVALSRLLARRAGAPMPVLFIDEGFGTQDAQGREALVEAIQVIRDWFRLIVVITHIEELKEHFDERIEVYKTPRGSLYRTTWA